MRCLCVYGVFLALLWLTRESTLHSRAQDFVKALVSTFHSESKNFENTINTLHPMALLSEKENNESCTVGHIIKQKYAADFINAMIKDDNDNKKCNH